MDKELISVFQLIVFIFSVMIHEIAHGAIALKLGDPTAKNAGRLTLNPIRHIDFFGSILLPLLLIAVKSPFLIGWAKPVPFNPMNLKDPKRGAGIIAAAGPLSNLLVAAVFGIFLRGLLLAGDAPTFSALAILFNIVVFVNVILAVFNLLPLPPLDGSSILFAFLPRQLYPLQIFLSRYGLYLLMFLIFFGVFDFLQPVIMAIYLFLVGSASIF